MRSPSGKKPIKGSKVVQKHTPALASRRISPRVRGISLTSCAVYCRDGYLACNMAVYLDTPGIYCTYLSWRGLDAERGGSGYESRRRKKVRTRFTTESLARAGELEGTGFGGAVATGSLC